MVASVECFYEAYDKGDNNCVYEFLIPRAKHELCYIHDDGEAFENSSYDVIMEHIRYSHIGCNCFEKNICTSFYKTEKALICYNSIQDYLIIKQFIILYPKHHNFCNVKASHCLYYSTEYDSDSDDEDEFKEFADAIQNERTEFFCSSYNDLCRTNGVFDKSYSNKTFLVHSIILYQIKC